MAWKDGADERFLQFIAENIDEAVMVETFSIVTTVMKSNGDVCVLTNCAPEQRSMTTIGLLRGGLLIEEAGFIESWTGGEEE